jgi:hypothetical protein
MVQSGRDLGIVERCCLETDPLAEMGNRPTTSMAWISSTGWVRIPSAVEDAAS